MILNSSKNMFAICKYNSGENLPERLLAYGYTRKSLFSITAGKKYMVFGMASWKGEINILLEDDAGLPKWFPISIFYPFNASLPNDWFFISVENEQGDLKALWGYKKLINDGRHYDDLLELEPEALREFYEEKYRRES